MTTSPNKIISMVMGQLILKQIYGEGLTGMVELNIELEPPDAVIPAEPIDFRFYLPPICRIDLNLPDV
jgi:hypothetical protein